MSYHIRNDSNAENFESHKGRGLDWTLYDGTLVHSFCATKEDAEADMEEIVLEAREHIDRLRQELEDAEFDLAEKVDGSSKAGWRLVDGS